MGASFQQQYSGTAYTPEQPQLCYVAKMANVECEKCTALHTQFFDCFECTIPGTFSHIALMHKCKYNKYVD